MAHIYPFRAWRYNPAQTRLDDVVTEPYDKITPAMQQAYFQKSPYNVVRMVLGLPELFDAEPGESVYGRAARDFAAWRSAGVLAQDNSPSIYAYAQRFPVPGSATPCERRGFIALGKLHEFSDGIVFPEEDSDSRSSSDRLALLQTTRAQAGQIFMLYSDPARTVETLLYSGNGTPDAEVTDALGVQHCLWRVTDPAAIRLMTAEMADKKLILADGREHYDAALQHARQHVPAKAPNSETRSPELPHPAHPAAAAMMTFVNMDSDGLVILPAHRVVQSLAPLDAANLMERLGEFFAVEAVPGDDVREWKTELDAHPEPAFVVVLRSAAWLLRLNDRAAATLLESLPPRQRSLPGPCLDTVVLKHVLKLNEAAMQEERNVRTCRNASEAVEQVRNGSADAAFLVRAVTVEQLKEVAFAGESMPPGTTDFYPNLLSGLTIYALE